MTVELAASVVGDGPPLVLLHAFPLTSAMRSRLSRAAAGWPDC